MGRCEYKITFNSFCKIYQKKVRERVENGELGHEIPTGNHDVPYTVKKKNYSLNGQYNFYNKVHLKMT